MCLLPGGIAVACHVTLDLQSGAQHELEAVVVRYPN